MGVSPEIRKMFSWHEFDEKKWDLLECNKEDLITFLGSLDAYVYNCNYKFVETQCRSTIEALLTGLPVIAPNRPNFIDQIWHKKNGFICEYYEDYKIAIKNLQESDSLRLEMAFNARAFATQFWCNQEKHLRLWDNIFSQI